MLEMLEKPHMGEITKFQSERAKKLGVPERILNNLKNRTENDPARLKINYNKYFEDIYKERSIVLSDPEISNGIIDATKIEKVLDELLEDWKQSSNRAIRTMLGGHVTEWMIAYAYNREKRGTDEFSLAIPTSSYMDESLHNDLVIKLKNMDLPNDGWFSIDLTTSEYELKNKMFNYDAKLKDKLKGKEKYDGMPILVTKFDFDKYMIDKNLDEDKKNFLDGVVKSFAWAFSNQIVNKVSFPDVWEKISPKSQDSLSEMINKQLYKSPETEPVQRRTSKKPLLHSKPRSSKVVNILFTGEEDNKLKEIKAHSKEILQEKKRGIPDFLKGPKK